MKIGNKDVKEILIKTDDDILLVSITDEDIIQVKSIKVEFVGKGEKILNVR